MTKAAAGRRLYHAVRRPNASCRSKHKLSIRIHGCPLLVSNEQQRVSTKSGTSIRPTRRAHLRSMRILRDSLAKRNPRWPAGVTYRNPATLTITCHSGTTPNRCHPHLMLIPSCLGSALEGPNACRARGAAAHRAPEEPAFLVGTRPKKRVAMLRQQLRTTRG